MFRHRATTLAIVMSVLCTVACARGPSFHEYRELLKQKAGAASQDCGLVMLDQSRSAAVACAQAALERKTAFMVIFQVPGIDSGIFHGLAVNATGDASSVQWDSDAYGGGRRPFSKPWVKELSCSAPSVTDEERPIACGEAVSAPARE